ncbi:hypothetical protein DL768_010682 [Monosporascus sp. mg162]|nr:hypothetical protein DL768_010682 [Monosporascus sp. mg162]
MRFNGAGVKVLQTPAVRPNLRYGFYDVNPDSLQTTAIVGVNPKVELIVYIGIFGSTDDGMGMSTMLQKFGRAGRSGAPATVLLIARPGNLDELGKRYATARCYRKMVSGWLDGRARRCGFGDNPYLAYAGREGGAAV